eukprot:5567666-Pyramimonas_sp.AAC.1
MVALRATRACVYLFNVHNRELGATAVTKVRDAVRAALAEARAEPLRVLVVLNGDFNISEESAMSLLALVAASRR